MDDLIDLALAVVFSVLKKSVKNTQKKAELKKAMLKLRNVINTTYFGDPDFQ